MVLSPANLVQYNVAESSGCQHFLVKFTVIAVDPSGDVSTILSRPEPQKLLLYKFHCFFALEVKKLSQILTLNELLIFHVLWRLVNSLENADPHALLTEVDFAGPLLLQNGGIFALHQFWVLFDRDLNCALVYYWFFGIFL